MRISASRRSAVAGALAVAAALLCAQPTLGQDDDDGRFEIRRAELELRDGIYFLHALADLQLSSEGRNALASGVPLSISYELEFLNRLRLWWDLEETTVRQRFEISWHALTERYLVTDITTGTQSTFATLEDALRAIGHIEDLPAIAADLLDEDLRYEVRLRVLLDSERLPGPLRLIAFWRRDWSIRSEWEVWRLDEE